MLDKLKNITCFIFDIDGVLTDGTVYVSDKGEQSRGFNIKDGYAIQLAVKLGYHVAGMTGSKSTVAVHRLKGLGVTDVFVGVTSKEAKFHEYIAQYNISPDNVIYMGDDIPDISLLKEVGLPACPADAVEEVKAISQYISPLAGGKGCVRDIIEKTIKLQGKWMGAEAYSW